MTTGYKTKLHEMVSTTPTDFWNDSCAISELNEAIAQGAVGATTNPVIVGYVLKKELPLWDKWIDQIIKDHPQASEVDLTWLLIEAMGKKGAELLLPVFEQHNKLKGRLSMQTNPQFWRTPEPMWRQAVHFSGLAPNIQVKIPVSTAGVAAIEEATFHGVNINATVCFSVPQAIAVAEAVERGLNRRAAEGYDISKMSPVCTIMVGRQDDWLKTVAKRDGISCSAEALEWAGVAVMKKAYRKYQERKYRTRLLAAAYRNLYQWSEFIGADMVLTITADWQAKINASNLDVKRGIDNPVDPAIIEELHAKFPEEFRKAYDENGMTPADFDNYGPNRRTLRGFLQGYDEVVQFMRNRMLPNPDIK
jgi:transaldolase